MCGKVSNKSWASLFCFSLVKSEATWLHPEGVRFEAEKYFFWIDVDRPSKWSTEMKLFAHFLHFGANLQLQFSSPLNRLLLTQILSPWGDWNGQWHKETNYPSMVWKLRSFNDLMLESGFWLTWNLVSVWLHGDRKSCESMSARRRGVMWTYECMETWSHVSV